MTFFDDDTSDSEPHSDAPQLDPSSYEPDEIEVGVAATIRPDGGVDLDYITYIDGMPTPTYDDLLAGEPWVHWDDEPVGELDDYPPSPPEEKVDDKPPVKDICEERKGWAVIRNPDAPDQWVAMPVDQVIEDVRDAT